MGFFKNVSLDVHAQALSKNFSLMREEYYSCIVANARNARGLSFPPEKAVLAGNADLCLKGAHWLIAMAFVRQMRYVRSEDDANMLLGCVMHHSWLNERDAVSRYVLHFKDLWNKPPELSAHMAFEIVNYILGEDSNPWEHAILVNLTTRTLAPFSSATKYTIAA